MDNEQDVLDSISTRTVTEEKQNVVTRTVTNRFAVFGMITGLIVIICGAVIGLGAAGSLGLEIDKSIGYVMVVAGAFMFCYFGMNLTHEKMEIVTTTAQKQIPIEEPLYPESRLKEREELIDGKINAVAAAIEKLALITAEFEEKVLAQENLRLASAGNAEEEAKRNDNLVRSVADAVAGAMREERQADRERFEREQEKREKERAEENARLIESYAKREEEINSARRELDEIERNQKAARERLEAEQARLDAEAEEKMAEYLAGREELNNESGRLEEERKNLHRELEEEREKLRRTGEELAREKERIEEERRLEAERKALEARKIEEARKAEEARIAAEREEQIRRAEEKARKEEEARSAEEARLSSLGLSPLSYAWSSNLRRNEGN